MTECESEKIKKSLSVFIFVFIACFSMSYSGYQEELERARGYMYTDYEEARRISREILAEDPEVPEALWIKSIALTNLADMQSSEEMQKIYYGRAEKLADRALDLAPDDPNANHAKAIVLGRMAENAGVREGLQLSREVKKYSDRVIELDGEHAGAWFVRGMLMYRIDTLSRVERWIANSLFGGLPFEADRGETLAALERAVKFSPDNIYFHLEFGKILKDYGNERRAKQVLESALELEPTMPGDEDYLEEASKLFDIL